MFNEYYVIYILCCAGMIVFYWIVSSQWTKFLFVVGKPVKKNYCEHAYYIGAIIFAFIDVFSSYQIKAIVFPLHSTPFTFISDGNKMAEEIYL